MNLEKEYEMVNRLVLHQVLRMHVVSGKLVNAIKDMYEGR